MNKKERDKKFLSGTLQLELENVITRYEALTGNKVETVTVTRDSQGGMSGIQVKLKEG